MNFSVPSAYPQYGPCENLWKTLNGFKGLPRVKMFLRLVCHEKILTNEERACRHLTLDHNCGFMSEGIDHTFRGCHVAAMLWGSLICSDR
ncbi:hypothetical protein GQ457_12G028930 [Hibiscus cannabinus]